MRGVIAGVLIGLAVFHVASATIGLDLSSECVDDCFSCLKGQGYSFAVPRVYMSTGQPDPTGPHTIYNAWAGGMVHVDGYMFPCPTCGNPQGQVSDCINNLRNFQCQFGMLWLDIEGPQYWMDQGSNVAFFDGLVQQASAMGVTIGIYTSASQWEPIMGDYEGGSPYPLWYAHYDGQPNFGDFSPFNGWTSPAIKQYAGDDNVCGLDLDDDWYPDGMGSGAPNYTAWALKWPKAFNVTGGPLRDLKRNMLLHPRPARHVPVLDTVDGLPKKMME